MAKLLDEVRDKMTTRHYSQSTVDSYVGWMRRYILFNNKRHPKDMRERDVEAFLNALATRHQVSASTQNQAFNALLYLYREVLHILQNGMDIRTLQTLMGHTDVRTTMGYLHVEINAGTGDRSPLDVL